MQLDLDINLRKQTIQDIQELKSKLRTAIKRQHTARNVTLRDKVCTELNHQYLRTSILTATEGVVSGLKHGIHESAAYTNCSAVFAADFICHRDYVSHVECLLARVSPRDLQSQHLHRSSSCAVHVAICHLQSQEMALLWYAISAVTSLAALDILHI
jgi:hypothetical protein